MTASKTVTTETKYEITYTYFGKERPTMSFSADSREDAIHMFHASYPTIPLAEIQNIREIITPTASEEKRLKRELNGIERTSEIQPTPITDDLVNYFRQQKATVRFLWAPFLDTAARERFISLGRPLPENSRAIDTGKFGGSTELWNVSCEVSFPYTSEIPTMPFEYQVDGKRVHIYDLGLGLELYCNRGFECTVVKK